MRAEVPHDPGRPQPRVLLGVVLSGGESRRMGRDKGLLQSDDGPWVLRMGEKLMSRQLPVVYSIRQSQLAAYSALLPLERIVVDADEKEGPLNGLLSVHRKFPDSDLLLLACDMQDLDASTLDTLIAAWQGGGADAYAYEVGGFLQPFCAIYTAFLLADTLTSLSTLLRSGSLHILQGDAAAFRNYNSL